MKSKNYAVNVSLIKIWLCFPKKRFIFLNCVLTVKRGQNRCFDQMSIKFIPFKVCPSHFFNLDRFSSQYKFIWTHLPMFPAPPQCLLKCWAMFTDDRDGTLGRILLNILYLMLVLLSRILLFIKTKCKNYLVRKSRTLINFTHVYYFIRFVSRWDIDVN